MNNRAILTFTAGAACTASLALLIAAGPGHDHGDPMDSPMDSMNDKMTDPPMDIMAEMKRLSTPNEHHAELGKSVGNWTAQTSFIMDPSQPPMEGEGKMSVKWVLGGRYVMAEFKMDFMGEPFEGIGYTGYDIAHEQYVSTWMDTMSTKITYTTGNLEDDGRLVLTGTATTPMGDNPMKIVSAWIDDDTFTDKFYDQMPDGTWNLSGTITYTRD